MIADYRAGPLGGWLVTVTAEDLSPRRLHARDPHEAFHAVLEELEIIAEDTDRPLGTIHQLDGDPAAWAMLAAREGFTECGTAGNSYSGFLA